jgi:hypothetical protein
MKILIEREHGAFLFTDEVGRSVLCQADYDYPSLARYFGWSGLCPCGETDGTVDCGHKTASDMIADAERFLRSRMHVVHNVDDSFDEYFQEETCL